MENSNLAHKAQTILGSPYEKEYLQMASKHTGIAEFPVSPTYITNANVIYVPNLSGVQD